MNGSFILDTNIVIALFGNDANVVTEAKKKAKNVYLPAIVVGELYYGALNSSKPEQNSWRINELLKEVNVLNCDIETGKLYSKYLRTIIFELLCTTDKITMPSGKVHCL